ncbi:Putative ring-cleaving dioxygenase MhqO [Rhodobacteraceae bacterium THAF1]|uniref:VOC family protein n=1 Tax=Palleronia sp. THAF1 TaxID=2587842 RepID=UPI000F3C1F30|nr:VOC family protein [Palleronia sp. THAF1]QFU09899.1 Putative ring-cleaving dioxygenase MhqO [Palleronia sp. THAF1]VDC17198.1 Putative ring-cleaving dioxygenase MhqO [Rhodobacteraceae bacterium THAF1]
MLTQINGLHHVTTIGSDPRAIDRFWTETLGMRRVKKTVNFDAPDVYHLYYGDTVGTPGTAMTYFPFPDARPGKRGTGEVGEVRLAIPHGAAGFWADRLGTQVVEDRFGAASVRTEAPDGDVFALVEDDDPRTPYAATIDAENAIRGFHSATLRVADAAPTVELLRFMGYTEQARDGDTTRLIREGGTANLIDVVAAPDMPAAGQSAGSVHHIAFAVDNRAAQKEVQTALAEHGFQVTPQIDRDYFWAIYFRTPGGILFEVATNEPGFDADEPRETLGQALKLPDQHEHLRDRLEKHLVPLG